jgi:hypothetical protein
LTEHDSARPAATAPSDVDSTVGSSRVPAQRRPPSDGQPARMSRLAFWCIVLVIVLAVAGAVVSWRVLHYQLLDAIGQAAGSALALLLIASIVGAVRRSRPR